MKTFALALVVIAFGALMVAGCPAANNASNKTTNTPANNTPAENK